MRRFTRFFVFMLCVQSASLAQAQTISPVQDLSFGQAIVTNNNSQHEIIIVPGGGFSNDPEISFITTPVAGVYRLTGATPFQVIDSVVITVDQQMIGAGEDFVLDNFSVTHPPQADNFGNALIDVGARMRTTGNFNTYMSSTTFTGMFTIDVNLL